MAFIDVVKWDAIPGVYVWKYPSEELSTSTQLIVSESQEAILLKSGRFIKNFGPGRHTLDTENVPVLAQLFKLPLGGRSPFTAEIWFINKAISLDIKWGTPDPIQLIDPKYKIMIPVRAFGQFGVQINHGAKFLLKLVGTLTRFDSATLVQHFKGVVISRVKEQIAQQISNASVSVLEINTKLTEIASSLEVIIAEEMLAFGLKLHLFRILSINVPEDDVAVNKLKAALAKKAEMEILGYNYHQERSFNTLEFAASNPGMGGGGVMGAAIGLGVGLNIGNAVGSAVTDATKELNLKPNIDHLQSNQKNSIDVNYCNKCGTQSASTSKFCSNCGSPMMAICKICGTHAATGAKFCAQCGSLI
jgi:membrane protease subunit (stomatin/prohibitin family)